MASKELKSRATEVISLPELKDIGRTHLPEPNPDVYLHEDVDFIVEAHQEFFVAAAKKTRRLNAMSLTQMVKDVFPDRICSQKQAGLYGQSLCQAFSHAIRTGGRATTGSKTNKAVLAVWRAAQLAELTGSHATAPAPSSTSSSSRPTAIKSEPCCLSLTKIMAMYSGGGVAVKENPFSHMNCKGAPQRCPLQGSPCRPLAN